MYQYNLVGRFCRNSLVRSKIRPDPIEDNALACSTPPCPCSSPWLPSLKDFAGATFDLRVEMTEFGGFGQGRSNLSCIGFVVVTEDSLPSHKIVVC